MQRLTLVLAALGLAAGATNAQPPGPPPGGRFDLDDIAVLLDLDAYQKGEVDRVLTEQREAQRAQREAQRAARGDDTADGERPSREDTLERREQGREELFGKLQNVLTEQQLAKLKILMAPPQGGRGPRGGPL